MRGASPGRPFRVRPGGQLAKAGQGEPFDEREGVVAGALGVDRVDDRAGQVPGGAQHRVVAGPGAGLAPDLPAVDHEPLERHPVGGAVDVRHGEHLVQQRAGHHLAAEQAEHQAFQVGGGGDQIPGRPAVGHVPLGDVGGPAADVGVRAVVRAVDAGVGAAREPGVPHAQGAEDPYRGLVLVGVAGDLLDEHAEHGVVDVPVRLPLARLVRRSLGDGRRHHLLRGERLEPVGVHLLGRGAEARAGTQPAGVGEQVTHGRGLGEGRREQVRQIAGDGCVESDALLRDELEHHRRGDHLGRGAGPEAGVRQRGRPRAQVPDARAARPAALAAHPDQGGGDVPVRDLGERPFERGRVEPVGAGRGDGGGGGGALRGPGGGRAGEGDEQQGRGQ